MKSGRIDQAESTLAGPLFTVVAASLTKWQDRLARDNWLVLLRRECCGQSRARDTEQVRLALPCALFLVLGYGAQSATARAAVRG